MPEIPKQPKPPMPPADPDRAQQRAIPNTPSEDDRRGASRQVAPGVDVRDVGTPKDEDGEDRPHVEREGTFIRVGRDHVNVAHVVRTQETDSGLNVFTVAGTVVVPKQHVDDFRSSLGE